MKGADFVKVAGVVAFLISGSGVLAQEHHPSGHQQEVQGMGASDGVAKTDIRQPVTVPPALKQHMLANMRDHLQALQEIFAGLSKSEYDKVAVIAEERLGVSSGKRHGAHQLAPYMPEGMSQVGGEMHRGASRLALAAQDASVTGDNKPLLVALGEVMAGCVACHSAYRLN